MLSRSHFSLFLSLLPLASAHFKLEYPPARGFDEDTLPTFPCGGQDKVSTTRTTVSMTNFSMFFDMGHDTSAMQVLLGLGSDPGSNFNITLHPTFREEGEGNFCLQDLSIPTEMGITDGMEATIQVVTNGDPNGGLYNCADVKFTTGSAPPSPTTCANGKGVTQTPFPSAAAARNANESTPEGQAQSGGASGSMTMSMSGSMSGMSMPSSTSSGNSGAGMMTIGWGLLGAAILGAVAAV